MSGSSPYEGLPSMDLSGAVFEKKAELDPEKLEAVMAEVTQLTQSNLADKAKWNNYLRILETAMRSVGYVVRIAAVV